MLAQESFDTLTQPRRMGASGLEEGGLFESIRLLEGG